MKIIAIFTLLGFAACSAEPAGQSQPVVTAGTAKDGTPSFAEDVLSEVVSEVIKDVPALAPFRDVMDSTTDPCPASLQGASQEFAEGLVSGFSTSFPDLTPCMADNTCLASKLAKIFARIFDANHDVPTSDVMALEYILYTDIFGELKSCQKSPQQALELEQIYSVMKRMDTDPLYAIKHQLVNVAVHGDELYNNFKGAAKAFHQHKNYKYAGEAIAKAYVTLLIGKQTDVKYPEAKNDLSDANVVALQHEVASELPQFFKELITKVTQDLHVQWPTLQSSQSCSEDVDAIRDDLVDFLNKVAKYITDKEGNINPDWDKISKVWEALKVRLELNLAEAVEDCAMGANQHDVATVVKQTLAAQTVDAIKPAVLAYVETSATKRDQQETAMKMGAPLVAKAQAQLYMKTFGTYVNASKKESDAQIKTTKIDKKCEEEFAHLASALEASFASYFLYNQTIARAMEMAAAALDLYGDRVIRACFIEDHALASEIAKEGVRVMKKAEADAASAQHYVVAEVEGSPKRAPSHVKKLATASTASPSNKKAPKAAAATTSSGGVLIKDTKNTKETKMIKVKPAETVYWEAETIYQEDESTGFPVKRVVIITSITVGVIALVALVSCLIFKCRKAKAATASPLLEGLSSGDESRMALQETPVTAELAAGV